MFLLAVLEPRKELSNAGCTNTYTYEGIILVPFFKKFIKVNGGDWGGLSSSVYFVHRVNSLTLLAL